MQDFIQAKGIRHGQIIHALRIAVTGKTTGFGLFDSRRSSASRNAWLGSSGRWHACELREIILAPESVLATPETC